MQKEVKQIICNTRVLTDAIQFASRMHTNLTSIFFTMYLVFIFQTYFVLFYSSAGHLALELCADVIVSAAARRSISVGGGGAPPVPKSRRRRRRGAAWAAKNSFF